MSVRSDGYDSETLDRIFCYFMRTILHLQESGIENIPLENEFQAPYKEFLDRAMDIVFQISPAPELARLLLDTEYDTVLNHQKLPREEVLGLQLIKELAWHIHYDEDYYGYLFSTENIWGNTACQYASLTFYPNLPEEIKNKY